MSYQNRADVLPAVGPVGFYRGGGARPLHPFRHTSPIIAGAGGYAPCRGFKGAEPLWKIPMPPVGDVHISAAWESCGIYLRPAW